MGFVSELSGQPKAFTECSLLVPGWEAAAIPEEKAETVPKQLGGEIRTKLHQILDFLLDAVDVVCKFKKNILKWMTT